MKLNHLNLTVSDVPAAREFLMTYFDLKDPYGMKASEKMAFLSDDNGMVISIFKGNDVSYPGGFHIGFIQESPEQVTAINQRMKDDGYDVEAPHKAHGSWTFYFQAPGGFTVEVLS